MIIKERTIVIPMTEDIVSYFASMNRSPVERSLSQHRIKWLQKHFERGAMLPFVWAMVNVNGVSYRINGQHTSYIFANKLSPIPKNGEVVLVQYKANSLEEVARAWSRFDPGDRTNNEMVNAYAGTDKALSAIPKDIHHRVIAGVKMAKENGVYRKMLSDSLGELVINSKDFTVFCYKLYRGSDSAADTKRILMRAPVIAAIFLTYNISSLAAEEFWSAVRDGEGKPRCDPDRTLHDYLMVTVLSNTPRAIGNVDGREEMLTKCIRAWNAWRAGRKLSVLKGGKRSKAA